MASNFKLGRPPRRRRPADDSPARKAKIALLSGWMELPGGSSNGVTAIQAIRTVLDDGNKDQYELLRNAFHLLGRDGKPVTARGLGNLLRGLKGNVIEGMKFTPGAEDKGVLKWIAEKIALEGLEGLYSP